jgi:flagellar motor switch protein FliM
MSVETHTLSQSDIDALLSGGTAGASRSGAAARPRGAEVELYDFRRPNRVSREKLRALEAMYERMSKALETWLIGRMRGNVTVNLQGVEQLTFGEFMLSLSSPCAAFTFEMADAGGQQGVIDVGLDFAYYVVDRLFGGSGEKESLHRGLTRIEEKANRIVAERICAQLSETWQDHVPLGAALSGFESVPEILQAGTREDPVLVASLEVRAGQVSALISISVPFVALEKFFIGQGNRRVKNPTAAAREAETSRTVAGGMLLDTRVPVSVRIPEFQLSMREIAALEPGSVIATPTRVGAEMDVWVGQSPRMRGVPGRDAATGALVLQVAQPLQRGEGRQAQTQPVE